MTHTIRAIVAGRWLAVGLAAVLIAACDGGPDTTATVGTSASTPITGATNPAGTAGAATLSWVAPTQNSDGSALTNLAGYRIYYGTGADALTEVIDVPTVGITAYVIDNLTAGTYYFSIRAYTSAGIESDLSNVVRDTIG